MDCDIIDLTDESKVDLNEDSKYGKIEDSIKIDNRLIEENNYKEFNETNFDYVRDYDRELDNQFNDFDNDYYDDINTDLNWDEPNQSSDLKNYRKCDDNQANDSNDNQSNIPSKIQTLNEDDDEIYEISSQSTTDDREVQSNLINQSKNSKIDAIDKEDDEISELDNELSVLFVVTPDKDKDNHSKNRNYSTPSILNQSPLIADCSPMIISNNPSYLANDSLTLNQNYKNSSSSNKSPTSMRFTSLKRNLIDTSFNQEILIGLDEPFDEQVVFDVNKRKQKRKTKLSEEERLAKQLEKQKEKERKRNERVELNRQKEKLKEKQRKIKEANKYLNLKNSSQHCTTIVSQSLIDKFLTNDDLLKKVFEERELNLEVHRFANEQPTVKWKRTIHSRNDTLIADKSVLNLSDILSKEEIDEDQLILILTKEQFVKMVYKFILSTDEQPEELFEFNENDQENVSLMSYIIRLIEQYKKSILFIVYNLESYFRTLKNREHRDFLQMMNSDQQPNRQQRRPTTHKAKLPVISRSNVEESILNTSLELMNNDTAVELKLKIKFQFVDNQVELINLIGDLSNSMAEAPYRRWRNSQEGFDWFVDGDSKSGSINIKELPTDITKLWLKHLLLFDKVSLPIAKSIIQKYPNLMALKDEYDLLDDVQAKESLLTSISINQNNRTINSEISKRIYKFLTEINEDEMLV